MSEKISVERTSEDGLELTLLEVRLYSDTGSDRLHVDRFGKMRRATKRHKFVAVDGEFYQRYSRNRKDSFVASDIPADMLDEAKRKICEIVMGLEATF